MDRSILVVVELAVGVSCTLVVQTDIRGALVVWIPDVRALSLTIFVSVLLNVVDTASGLHLASRLLTRNLEAELLEIIFHS